MKIEAKLARAVGKGKEFLSGLATDQLQDKEFCKKIKAKSFPTIHHAHWGRLVSAELKSRGAGKIVVKKGRKRRGKGRVVAQPAGPALESQSLFTRAKAVGVNGLALRTVQAVENVVAANEALAFTLQVSGQHPTTGK